MMNASTKPIRVAVLMGGPDQEHDVSLASGQRVAMALREDSNFEVTEHTIDRPDGGELLEFGADVGLEDQNGRDPIVSMGPNKTPPPPIRPHN